MSKEEKDTKITINETKEVDDYSGERKAGRVLPISIIGLFATCYYIFVVELCIFTVQLLEAKVTFLVIFHLLFLLCVWCYLRTIMTPPAVPPAKFRLSESDKQLYLSDERPQVLQEILIRAAKDLPIYTKDPKGDVRYCTTCQVLKPDRCHHCPVCNVCILKLDHHCVFLNNCVGFSNYKFFLLGLMYGALLFIFTSEVSLCCSILFWTHQLPNSPSQVPIIVLFCLSTFFAITLVRLFLDHFELAVRNITDLEDYDSTEEFDPYNLSISKNLREVFGNEKKYWLLPIFNSLGDGFTFPIGDATEDIEKNAAFAKPPNEGI
ncbi:palmitoyltransferase ZDHHC20-A-like [Xenopus laevis]|uniref:Palmitoyltransferase n=1 Tax=Xenopus laevis TaxID=8355 RepID=A0A8J1KU25_XENLA|nr:palmitoyltransferase ZDHHC20-A-like [Xenopus laevis]